MPTREQRTEKPDSNQEYELDDQLLEWFDSAVAETPAVFVKQEAGVQREVGTSAAAQVGPIKGVLRPDYQDYDTQESDDRKFTREDDRREEEYQVEARKLATLRQELFELEKLRRMKMHEWQGNADYLVSSRCHTLRILIIAFQQRATENLKKRKRGLQLEIERQARYRRGLLPKPRPNSGYYGVRASGSKWAASV
jgi:hypothetical protein